MSQPASSSQPSAQRPECLEILGLMPPVTLEDVKQAYLVRAREAHPDRGGSQQDFVRVQQAFEDATEFVKFKASKLEWLASKIDAYAEQQEVATETIERGGSIEMEETDWLRKSFGDDFGHVADKLVAVLAKDSPFSHVESMAQLDAEFPGASQIVDIWFANYKGPDGGMEGLGFEDAESARAVLEAAAANFEAGR